MRPYKANFHEINFPVTCRKLVADVANLSPTSPQQLGDHPAFTTFATVKFTRKLVGRNLAHARRLLGLAAAGASASVAAAGRSSVGRTAARVVRHPGAVSSRFDHRHTPACRRVAPQTSNWTVARSTVGVRLATSVVWRRIVRRVASCQPVLVPHTSTTIRYDDIFTCIVLSKADDNPFNLSHLSLIHISEPTRPY